MFCMRQLLSAKNRDIITKQGGEKPLASYKTEHASRFACACAASLAQFLCRNEVQAVRKVVLCVIHRHKPTLKIQKEAYETLLFTQLGRTR